MTMTICFINQKGGCGKSTTCFHLAGEFAKCRMETLLVDTDPQGSLSRGFLGSCEIESLNSGQTVAALFDDTCHPASLDVISVSTPFEGISLVPANQTLARHNTPSPELTETRQQSLRSYLEQTKRYDIVLIDCPPNLYFCSWNAMLAADFVVIPVPPEDFGTQGLRVVHQAIENARRLNPGLRLLGHVVTRYDGRLLVHQAYDQRLRSLYGGQVLQTVIPEAAAFKVASASRQPVGLIGPRSKAARMIRALSSEILERVSEKTNRREVA